MNDSKNRKSSSLLSLALAGAIGATLGIIFAPKSGEETRQEIADKASALAKKFKESRAAIQETIEDIFGEFSADLERTYIEMRADILANVEEAKDLSEKKYQEIVTEVVDNFSKAQKWSTKIGDMLKKNFGKHWEDVKDKD